MFEDVYVSWFSQQFLAGVTVKNVSWSSFDLRFGGRSFLLFIFLISCFQVSWAIEQSSVVCVAFPCCPRPCPSGARGTAVWHRPMAQADGAGRWYRPMAGPEGPALRWGCNGTARPVPAVLQDSGLPESQLLGTEGKMAVADHAGKGTFIRNQHRCHRGCL